MTNASIWQRGGEAADATDETDDVEGRYWTLRGAQDVFEGISAAALTMAEVTYVGRLVAPEEKAKHNFVLAFGQTVRPHGVYRRSGGRDDRRDPR